jgi:alpha-tubulin suppressor-like RCC1 family protein
VSSLSLTTLALLATCGEEPTTVLEEPPEPSSHVAIPCEVSVRAGTLECGSAQNSGTSGAQFSLTLGGQGIYVRLTSANVSYDGSSVFQADISVQNLIGQALGTSDGVTVDPEGVRVFLHSGPTVTGGTGTVTVANADGVGAFTGSNQPYFQYDELLGGGVTSGAKTWQWDVPPSVTTFEFYVYVTAEVQYPNGWVEVVPAVAAIGVGETRQLTAVVRDAIGRNTGEEVTWTSADTDIASVDSTGLVTGVATGSVTISASGAARTGEAAIAVVPLSFATVSAGVAHTCGLTSGGYAHCWGYNFAGQVGDGSTTNRDVPVGVVGGLAFHSLVAGRYHQTCALTGDGTPYCWGLNSVGQLGDGTTDSRPTPTAVLGGLTFTQIAPGGGATCGLTSGGAAYCWGYNVNGEVGDGSFIDRTAPVPVVGGLTFKSLVAGAASCGLTASGTAYCWGNNLSGAVGDSTFTNRNAPVPVAGGFTFDSLTASAHTCGLTPAGKAYCWGYNFSGPIGDGTRQDRNFPVPVVGNLVFTQLVTGTYHTCGLTDTGVAYCWGDNLYGWLGVGSTEDYLTAPAPVVGGLTYTSLTAGLSYTCGQATTGGTYCWGRNFEGQLGEGGTSGIITTPVRVHGT